MLFSEIYGEIEAAIKAPKGSKRALVKAMCNMVYFEILSSDDLYTMFWLRCLVDSYKAKAPVDITGISKTNPGVFDVVEHGFVADDIVTAYNVEGMTEVNIRTFKVNTVPSDDTLTLKTIEGTALNTTDFTTYDSGGKLLHRGITLSTNIELIIGNPEWHDEDEMIEISDTELVEDSSLYWDDSPSRPERFQHRKQYISNAEVNEIWFFQGSDAAYDLRFWAEKIVPELSADSDVPQMPTKFHRTIVAGVITRLKESKVQVEAGIVWPQLYKLGLDAIREFNHKYYQQNDATMPKDTYMI